jgi:predicted N-acetyltransferase YhbS
MLTLAPFAPADGPAVETLLDSAFGPGRQTKVSYRYRVGVRPIADLGYVARVGEQLVGSIAYWPIEIGVHRSPALLLGPLAVDPARQNMGIGRALVFHTLPIASRLGYELVLLVGDPAYYRRFGFSVVSSDIHMPDEKPDRLQYRELTAGALATVSGVILPGRDPKMLAQSSATELRAASV